MPWNSLAPGVLPPAPAFQRGDWDLSAPKALGGRPAMDDGAEIGPSPAAEHRAETVFEVAGLILIFLMAFLACWILVRKRL